MSVCPANLPAPKSKLHGGGSTLKIETAKKDLEFQAQPKKTGKIENVGEIGLSQWVLLGAGTRRPRQPNTMDKYYLKRKSTIFGGFVKRKEEIYSWDEVCAICSSAAKT